MSPENCLLVNSLLYVGHIFFSHTPLLLHASAKLSQGMQLSLIIIAVAFALVWCLFSVNHKEDRHVCFLSFRQVLPDTRRRSVRSRLRIRDDHRRVIAENPIQSRGEQLAQRWHSCKASRTRPGYRLRYDLYPSRYSRVDASEGKPAGSLLTDGTSHLAREQVLIGILAAGYRNCSSGTELERRQKRVN